MLVQSKKKKLEQIQKKMGKETCRTFLQDIDCLVFSRYCHIVSQTFLSTNIISLRIFRWDCFTQTYKILEFNDLPRYRFSRIIIDFNSTSFLSIVDWWFRSRPGFSVTSSRTRHLKYNWLWLNGVHNLYYCCLLWLVKDYMVSRSSLRRFWFLNQNYLLFPSNRKTWNHKISEATFRGSRFKSIALANT